MGWGMRGFWAGLAVLSLAWASPSFATTSVTRTSSFAYDASTGLLTQEVVEPNTSALRLEKDTVYDAFGNKTSVSLVGVDIVTRTNTTTYDTKGQFPTTATNALGHQESWVYDARFGKPTSHTGPNGLTATAQYDAYGRKTLETHEDGTKVSYQYLFCSGVNGGTLANCPTNGAYGVVVTPLASDGVTQNGPKTTTYYDTVDRKLAADAQSFTGSTIRGASQYDSLGRISQTSRPYFLSGGTPQWTVMTYDALNRVTKQTFPDNSTAQMAFHGLSITATNGLSQTKTIVKNSQGQVVSVTDALSKTTTYTYDPFSNLTKVTDPVGNVTTFSYDTRGRKTAMSDPDMGSWTYAYDTPSELVAEIDAKSQNKTYSYDKLGRMTQRIEPDVTCTWAYDTQTKGIGKLASASNTNGYVRVPSYDSLGRPSSVQLTIDGNLYTSSTAYDSNGRVSQVTYPSGFQVTYAYTSLSFPSTLTNTSTGQAYWTANTMDQELHLTQQTQGNTVVTNQGFDAKTGRLLTIQAGTGNTVENLIYTYDVLGNVKSRTDSADSVSETFGYDALNRLTSTTMLNVPSSVSSAYRTDPFGNLTWGYGPPGGAQPHAVLTLQGGTTNATFTYDSDGNQTTGLGRTIAYTSYNKPFTIAQGTTTLSFEDDTDHQRIKQVAPEGTTIYVAGMGVLAEQFTGTGGTVTWNEYLSVAGQMVGVRFNTPSTNTLVTRYFHKDNLGSIVALTDETGAVAQRIAYDVWGKVRYPNGAPDPTNSISTQTTRNFTGQERLADVGLVHMNGRVYDPLVARFMSADPFVQDPTDTQSLNRYTYARDNPLAFTDPTGYFLSGFFRSIGHFFSNFFRNPLNILALAIAVVTLNPELIGITGLTAGESFLLAVAGGAIAGGLSGGGLKGALFGAVGSALFWGAGQIAPLGSSPSFGTILKSAVLKAVAGGLVSVIAGGDFKSGFLAAGITALAGPEIQSLGLGPIGNAIAYAVIGGTMAAIGGGNFANGAFTAFFTYLVTTALSASAQTATSDSGSGSSGPTLSQGTGGVAFVGGFFDYTIGGNAISAYNAYIATGASAAYFTWDQAGSLASWLDANAGAVTAVYGHSYGGDTAASVFAAGHGTGVPLITVDPVSWFRPSFAAVAATASPWIDINAVGGQGSLPNFLAGIGGAWNNAPSSYTNVTNLPYSHAQIMCVVAPAGCAP
jgi:RHS repeat-associated protein